MNGKPVSGREPRNERHFWHSVSETIDAGSLRESLDAASKPSYRIRWLEKTYPACNDGPCQQGDGICPFPDSCQIPPQEDEKPTPFFRPMLAGLGLAAILVVGLIWRHL